MFTDDMNRMFSEANKGFSLKSSPARLCYGDGDAEVSMSFEIIGNLMFFHTLSSDDVMAELKRSYIETVI
jgi:hypothetical protein